MRHRQKYDCMVHGVCVCVCVCVCVHVFLSPPPSEAVLAVSPAQSVRLCELKPVVGGIWAGAPAPLKSFAQTRHSGTKAREFRETLEHVLRRERV